MAYEYICYFYLHQCIPHTQKHMFRHQHNFYICPVSKVRAKYMILSLAGSHFENPRWPTSIPVFYMHQCIPHPQKHIFRHQDLLYIYPNNKIMAKNVILPISRAAILKIAEKTMMTQEAPPETYQIFNSMIKTI